MKPFSSPTPKGVVLLTKIYCTKIPPLGVRGLFLFILFLTSCTNNKEPEIAFYHWKTAFKPEIEEINTLNQLKTRQIYAKFFDVSWDEETKSTKPLAEIIFTKENLSFKRFEIVPTIFITNKSILNTPEKDIKLLSERIFNRIMLISNNNQLKIKEIQLDCDWSARSEKRYFQLIANIKNLAKIKNIQVSCTIRLHQYKYQPKIGIPPADKGVLMCYNIGELAGDTLKPNYNSILDIEIAKSYLKNIPKYPLPLDFALPIYSWAVVLRDKQVINLINDIHLQDLLQNTAKFAKITDNSFKVLNSHYLQGTYLYENDIIRVEESTPRQLKQAILLLKDCKNTNNPKILFYHLSKTNLQQFNYETIKNIIQGFN